MCSSCAAALWVAASPSRRYRFTGTLPNNSLSLRCCGPSTSPCVEPSSSTLRSLLVSAIRPTSSGGPADLWSAYPVCCVTLSGGSRAVGTIRRDMTCKTNISAVDAGLSKCTAEVTGTAPCCDITTLISKNLQRGLDRPPFSWCSCVLMNQVHYENTVRPLYCPKALPLRA